MDTYWGHLLETSGSYTDPLSDQQLQESEELLRAIYNNVAEGILTVDNQCRILNCNPAIEELFGYTRKQLHGQHVTFLMPQCKTSSIDDNMLECQLERSGRKAANHQDTGITRSGRSIPLEITVTSIHMQEQASLVVFIRDISRRVEADNTSRLRLQEMAHSGRLASLGEMTSSLTHELNQPLTAILTYAQACQRLLHRGKLNGQLDNALTQIIEQTRRASAVSNHLRRFIRKGDTERSAVDINHVMHEVLHLINHELKHHHIDVELDIQKDIPMVLVDRLQIEQVVLNLLRNAVEAMAETGQQRRELNIRTRREDKNLVLVEVEDTGGGLPEGDIFAKYYSTKSDGMGMGLPLCRKIIRAHGSDLTATNNHIGGASFIFFLPADPSSPGIT